MDALSGIFASVGPGGTAPTFPGGPGGGSLPTAPSGALAKILPLMLAGSGIFGTIGNIQANKARNDVLQQQMNYTKYLQNLTPAQITQMISQYQKPLSSSLISNVSNATQAQLASRGLSQAPGIFASSLGQGLAPYELQEQQLAQDALFKKLGLPISARPSPFGPFPQTTNTSAIWQQLMQRFMQPNAWTNQVPSNVPNDTTAADLISNILQGQTPGLTPSTGTGGGVD